MKNTTTSLTVAIKAILSDRAGIKPTVKEVLEVLASEFPSVKASYRPVFGTLKRLSGMVAEAKVEAEATVENILLDLTAMPVATVKGKVHFKGSRKALTA